MSSELDDSDLDSDLESDSPPSIEEFRAELRECILTRLGLALDAAADRLKRAASGESVFTNPFDLKATLALLNLAPELLAKFELQESAYCNKNYGIPLIPKCPICGAGPGAHWPDYCPQRTEENKQDTFSHRCVE
jgi:hypothetical protein